MKQIATILFLLCACVSSFSQASIQRNRYTTNLDGVQIAVNASSVSLTNVSGTNSFGSGLTTNIVGGVTNISGPNGTTNWSSTFTNSSGISAQGFPWTTNTYQNNKYVIYTLTNSIPYGAAVNYFTDSTFFASGITNGVLDLFITPRPICPTNSANTWGQNTWQESWQLSGAAVTRVVSGTALYSTSLTGVAAQIGGPTAQGSGSASITAGWTTGSCTNQINLEPATFQASYRW